MKSLNRVAVAIVGLVVVLLFVGFLLPNHWHAEEKIIIEAPPERVYLWAANFKEGWSRWSPFGLATDAGMHMQYEGPEMGIGATQRWSASKSGDGQMTIVAADPTQGVRYQLSMVNGFAITGNLALLPQEGGGTQVVWTDDGEFTNPISRYLGLAMPSMLAGPMTRGLASLKIEAEQHNSPSAMQHQ